MADGPDREEIKRLVVLELSALRLADVVTEDFEGARPGAGTPIFDVNGELLFHRVPLLRGRTRIGYADLAVHPALGGPLLSVSQGFDWSEPALRKEATAAARRHRVTFDRIRFVAFSYPKVAVQFLRGKEEVLMLELVTWAVVEPGGRSDRKPLEPESFERWSLLDELPAARRKGARKLEDRLELLSSPRFRKLDATAVSKALFGRVVTVKLVDTREVHYSSRQTDHHVCYELRGQETNVWCVGASVQMLLDFYRYGYTQVRLAQELGLGTLANPNGLPYANVALVVSVIEQLTSNALDATMVTNPGLGVFQTQIKANRPLISFVPGHSRTVVGYTSTTFSLAPLGFRGLLIYDPWPPNVGVITRWENFDTQIYQFAYSAAVTLA